MLAELPDLWDVNISNWPNDSQTSRFAKEGFQEDPTSLREAADHQAGGRRRPLHLARHHGLADQARHPRLHRRRPALDRRSLPAQEDRGRPDRRDPRMHRLQHLRVQRLHVDHLRCTQNPTMGEEWRRGWHPGDHPAEEIRKDGAGGRRGPGRARGGAALRRGAAIEVHLAEATDDSAAASRAKAGFPALPNGRGCATGGSRSSSGWPMSRSTAAARSKPSMCSNSERATSRLRPAQCGVGTASGANPGLRSPGSIAPTSLRRTI